MGKYFYSYEGAQYGPYSMDELKFGRHSAFITDDTLIWSAGSHVRTKAKDLTEFNDSLAKKIPQFSDYTGPSEGSSESRFAPDFEPPPIPTDAVERFDHQTSDLVTKKKIFIISNILEIYKKSFTFEGRASRAEFWGFYLFYNLFLVLLLTPYFSNSVFNIIGDTWMVIIIFNVLSIPAFIALLVRRLHDLGWSGYWVLMICTPLSILLLILCCFAGTTGHNNYGRVGGRAAERTAPTFSSSVD